jgi:two-component sensor histidine kinase
LLQLQRRGLESDDEKGHEALLESQSRVGAMGLIHIKLYQAKWGSSIHMPEYVEDLGETLLDAYRLEEQVEIFYDVADINLEVDIAMHLGLIINELVTNSMKYAFPKGQEGTIEIALHHEDEHLLLVVADNGVGTAAAKKRANSTSFGNKLIGLLTQKLRGEVEILEGKGYSVGIRFPEQSLVSN